MLIVCYYNSFFTHRTFHLLLGITIPCHCDLFSKPASYGSGNVTPTSLPDNNINKGRWTQNKHKIFMQEYEKYGNNCMLIEKVLTQNTRSNQKAC